ncbi:MAG: excinuclease ABC subunit UvrC [Clostridia bacterium]|nr:excinuclease ABC subunit UvrC [Clostridia bacterium]
MQLPLSPGVYIMHNEQGDIIYIGKAKALKNRVSQYFGSDRNHGEKVRKMVENVDRFEYIVTDSEFEALVLECSLIKQYMPKYNILLRDDKGYSYIKITNEPWPRILSALQKYDDNATYIGPYMSSFAVTQAVTSARKIFLLPDCTRRFPQEIGKGRPCLNYYIKQCCAPCRGGITQEEYQKTVEDAVEFLKSGNAALQERFTREMEEAAEALNFEKAALLRDRINALRKLTDTQKVVAKGDAAYDVIAHAQDHHSTCFMVFRYLDGRLSDQEYHITEDFLESEDLFGEFMERFYAKRGDIPKRIYTDIEFDFDPLARWLSSLCGHKVEILNPKRGEQLKLVEMCRENAAEQLRWGKGRTAKELSNLEELSSLLKMDRPPEYIEMYDISNLSGSENVAGMIVYRDGRPLKSAYRTFKIKTVAGQDDYASMAEVIDRRLTEYEKSETEDGFGRLPDLILLDGGRGQVSAVEPILRKHQLSIPLFGVVKDGKHRTRAVTAAGGEISIRNSRGAFTLLADLQEEVHRFAIGFHRKSRARSTLSLTLTQIEGIGEKRAQALLRHFKTLKAIRGASVEELSEVRGMSRAMSEKIYEHFREPPQE